MSTPTFYVLMYSRNSDVPAESRPCSSYEQARAIGEAELYRDKRHEYYEIVKRYERRD
jgi:hypothetical protein